ncbi:hypothetical protein SNEBB_001311 [Seison nebaliae]|nr:hypothetical protein SNEBB_001311 [Seison nebaliae]
MINKIFIYLFLLHILINRSSAILCYDCTAADSNCGVVSSTLTGQCDGTTCRKIYFKGRLFERSCLTDIEVEVLNSTIHRIESCSTDLCNSGNINKNLNLFIFSFIFMKLFL